MKQNPFKVGDKVRYKDDDGYVYTVYAIYSPTMVSLGLRDYPDTEQDNQININKIVKIKNKFPITVNDMTERHSPSWIDKETGVWQ